MVKTHHLVAGGKKPLSSSCPYIVADKDNKVVLAGGAAGGSTIISANTQVARNVLDYNMTAAEALAAPRLHNQILPNVSQVERDSSKPGQTPVKGFSADIIKGLEKKGHKIEWIEGECIVNIDVAALMAVNTAVNDKMTKDLWADIHTASRSTPCAIKFVHDEDGGSVKWEAAGDPRKYDSGGSVYYA